MATPVQRWNPASNPFAFLFIVYLMTGMAETMISPLFPLVREDLHLTNAAQGSVLAVVTASVAVANIVGGAMAGRWTDRALVRASLALLAGGLVGSGISQHYAQLLVAQAVMGFGFGVYYPVGLAAVARLAASRQGRAIASYGSAYSIGPALAGLGVVFGSWRGMFVVSGLFMAALAARMPRWDESPRSSEHGSLLSQLVTFVKLPAYQQSVIANLSGLTMHFVVIGFLPLYFVDRGIELALMGVLVAAGRIASVGSKVLVGRLFDTRGGAWAAQGITGATVVMGALLLSLPAVVALLLVVPFIALSSAIFPTANVLLVGSLPAQSAWGIGTMKAVLLAVAAVFGLLVSALLTVFPLQAVMVGALGVPAAAFIALRALGRRSAAMPATPEPLSPG